LTATVVDGRIPPDALIIVLPPAVLDRPEE
jgi:hypothetical protein